jgi:hypothetical protein
MFEDLDHGASTWPELICVCLCSIPCSILVFARYVIIGVLNTIQSVFPAICQFFWQIISSFSHFLWDNCVRLLRCLQTSCLILYDYVIFPAILASSKVLDLIIEYGLVPFYNGTIILIGLSYTYCIEPMVGFVSYILYNILYNWIISPIGMLIFNFTSFLCENILNPCCIYIWCEFIPVFCKFTYTYVWCPVYDLVDLIAKFIFRFILMPLYTVTEILFNSIIIYIWEPLGKCAIPCFHFLLESVFTPIKNCIDTSLHRLGTFFAFAIELLINKIIIPLTKFWDWLIQIISISIILPLLRFFNIPIDDYEPVSPGIESSEVITLTTIRGTPLTLSQTQTPVSIPSAAFRDHIEVFIRDPGPIRNTFVFGRDSSHN